MIHINQHKVGKISFADKSPFTDSETGGYIVSHFSGNKFRCEQALMTKFKHGDECMLYQGSTRWSSCIGLHLLLDGMWRMISGNHINSVIKQRFSDSIAIGDRFDGRIPFNQISLGGVIAVAEP